ncbi:MAG: hypothetical protein ACRD1N_01135, partial [Terriglobia bacterium]
MPPPMPQSVYAGLWRVDHTFKASIHIKNTMVANSVQVTPALFMADGKEYDLSPINLGPNAVADVDANKALANATAGIAAHNSQYGSAELKYMNPGPGVVTGEISMIDIPRSLLFKSGFGMMMSSMPAMVPSLQIVEGLWWKHDPTIDGFVDLANTTGNPINVTLRVVGAHGLRLPSEQVSLAPHASRMLDLDDLTAGLPGLENQEGGIRVQWTGYMGDVTVDGGLEGDGEGYSADLPFWPHKPPSSTGESMNPGESQPVVAHSHKASDALTLAAVGIMAGFPAVSMNFPSGVRFTPYITLRNTTQHPLALTLVLYLANNGQSQSFPLPRELLAPDETRQMDIAGNLANLRLQNFDGFINLTYSYQGAWGDLLMAAGSVDQTGNYVFQVLPQGVTPGWAKDIAGWTVDGGYDTMFTLWNPASQPEDLIATFYDASGSGTYQLPVHLAAYTSVNIDMAQLIALGEPDATGKTFPRGVTGGSATFSGTRGIESLIEVAVNAAEFSVANATCGYYCICCSGVCNLVICAASTYVAVNGTIELYAYAYYSNGVQHDVSSQVIWSSDDTTLAQMLASPPGEVQGVAIGAPIISVQGQFRPSGQVCGCAPTCPGPTTFSADQQIDVISVQVTSADLTSDGVTVALDGPTGVSGTLTVTWNGPSGNTDIANTNEGVGSYPFNPSLTGLVAGQYSGISATWLSVTGQHSYNFYVLGNYRHSQYNTPTESSCTGGTGSAYLVNSVTCAYQTGSLVANFISQSWLNGSGITAGAYYGYHTEQNAQYCINNQKLPADASGKSFAFISSITPGCGSSYALSSTTIAWP